MFNILVDQNYFQLQTQLLRVFFYSLFQLNWIVFMMKCGSWKKLILIAFNFPLGRLIGNNVWHKLLADGDGNNKRSANLIN